MSDNTDFFDHFQPDPLTARRIAYADAANDAVLSLKEIRSNACDTDGTPLGFYLRVTGDFGDRCEGKLFLDPAELAAVRDAINTALGGGR